MEYSEALKYLAPCGLDCGRCADYEHGEIKELSTRLVQLLCNYGRVAKIKMEATSQLSNFPQFEEILTHFSHASCNGCRGDNVQCFIKCAARTCCKEKNVDFCFQCDEFPCRKQFEDDCFRRGRWMQRNNRMKEIGVVEYYDEQVKLPRY